MPPKNTGFSLEKMENEMKKLYSTYKHPENWKFAIEDGGDVGFYLYVYQYPELFEADIRSGEYGCRRHQQDHLQDTLEIAKEQAYEDFGVPLDSWVEIF